MPCEMMGKKAGADAVQESQPRWNRFNSDYCTGNTSSALGNQLEFSAISTTNNSINSDYL